MVTICVFKCDVCQRYKSEKVPYPRLLQPLRILKQAWQKISMDFIEGLSRSEGKDTILVIVDCFTKCAHFMGLSHLFSTSQVVILFMDGVGKPHGIPSIIVSDWDVLFISKFWEKLFRILRVKLHHSIAYHPQIDSKKKKEGLISVWNNIWSVLVERSQNSGIHGWH